MTMNATLAAGLQHEDAATLIAALGADIESAWKRSDYDELKLAEIAQRSLRAHALHESTSFMDIARWANRVVTMPRQYDLEASFGQPPVTLYNGSRFYIEALFWLDNSPSIHSHSFSGAFQVLDGSSLHSVYEFRSQESINTQVLVGDLRLAAVEHLRRGEVRAILPGNLFIHSTFHIDVPTVSLVVRTHTRRSFTAQFQFHPPGLALDSLFSSDTTARRIQLLRMLWDIRHPQYQTELRWLMEHDDLESAIRYLELDLGMRNNLAACTPIMATLRKRHGSKAGPIVAAMTRFSTEVTIRNLRYQVRDARLRFFLGVALIAPDRESALALIAKRFPDESPVDVVVESVLRLGGTYRQISGLRFADADANTLRSLLDPQVHKSEDSRRLEELRQMFARPSFMAAFM